MVEFSVPAGQAPPFAIVTTTDHRAWIIIAAAYGLSCVLLFSVIRICIRLSIAPPFGLDDVLIGLATLISVIQSSIILYAASHGLGKSVELLGPETLTKIQKLFYSSRVLLTVALGLSKCSVAALLLRMTLKIRQILVFRGALVILSIWTVGAVLAITLQCNLSHPWVLVSEQCPEAFPRIQVIGGFDIATELGLFFLAVYLIWNIRLSASNKCIVLVVFGVRLLIIVIIAFRIATFDKAGYTTNPTMDETLYIIWSQAELDFSVVAATIPTLRRFISGLATYYGALDQKIANEGSTYEDIIRSPLAKGSLTRELQSNSSQGNGAAKKTDQKGPLGEWGNEGITATQVVAQDSNSVGTNDSRQMIIKRDTSWTVDYESSRQT